jgi:hypothetical protein
MRSTCGNTLWVFNDNQELLALSMGADATTEHEMGSRGIASDFGYSYAAQAGVAARKMTRLPETFGAASVTVAGEDCFLLSSHLEMAQRYAAAPVRSELRFFQRVSGRHDNTCAAWDAKSFAVLARGEDIDKLKVLYQAFLDHDVMAGGLLYPTYRVGGLVFAVASRVPSELLEQTQRELDEDVERSAIFKASGIEELLRKAGKQWFSLSQTRWADQKQKTIRVWLNPMDQHRHNCGWYTLEELREWASDTGPILRSRKVAAT